MRIESKDGIEHLKGKTGRPMMVNWVSDSDGYVGRGGGEVRVGWEYGFAAGECGFEGSVGWRWDEEARMMFMYDGIRGFGFRRGRRGAKPRH